MGSRPSRSLIEILRSTAEKVELNSDLAPDDPAVIEFKRSIMLSIAELEINASTAPNELVSQTDKPFRPQKAAEMN